ncbi:unnamed protein product [Darwinula stevensoni]|uniref:Fatty acid hydroxylase domain-containing protein n=1 Tax=Darwinula stevensoni TaxID=69355 RepID=A0A7R9ADF6_9CRUS|nr:unnamed protein product [Darwinula stevensoni]CAG0901042.1 unnamed protein product [Darwinula stevensoni]
MDRNETGIIWARIKEVGLLFYLVDPRETIFEKPEEVPDYISQAVPYIVLGVILEQVLRWKQGKPLVRPDEGMISLAFTFLMEITLEIYRGMGYGMYFYVYEHWRLFDFEWDSPWTWIMTALVVDFRYYVLHRALHEVSLFWAIHQLHHISEGYNLTMAAQNSFLLPYLDSCGRRRRPRSRTYRARPELLSRTSQKDGIAVKELYPCRDVIDVGHPPSRGGAMWQMY